MNGLWIKWFTGVVGTVLVTWMGFMSVMLVNINSTITRLDTEIIWLKNQATMGGRNTAEDGARRDVRIRALEECCDKSKERVVRLETQQETCLERLKQLSP